MSETPPSNPGMSVGDIKKSLYERGSWGSVRATKKSLMPYGPEPKIPEDPICVEKRIDHNGGELWNETFGFSLSIPPGALAEGASEVITLTLLAEKADSLKLHKDDMIVSCGFKCSPAGLKFLKPVHLTIPHCAVLTDPSKVDTTLYLSDGSGLMASQKTSSHSCVARRNHFDVFLTQLAGGWPTIVFSERSFVSHLKMLCEVYFPREIQKHHDDCPFEVCLYKDFKGVQETRQYKRHESSVIVEGFPVEFLLSVEDIHHHTCFIHVFPVKAKKLYF
ncbi:uncharacterized protein [Diadema antillarum]|uniref:uncharacterized protein n=1 Tax=Diadema antillarum TaxID=105358 RepID=UPI003A87A055